MSVKFEVKMTEKIMYDFLLYHNYSHLSGLAGAFLGVVGLWLGIESATAGNVQSAICGFAVAALLLVMPPFRLKKTAKVQVQRTPMFAEAMEYEFHEEGVTVRQGEDELETKWSEFRKAVSTESALILYLTSSRAMLFPKKSMGNRYEAAVKMISTHMPAAKVKIRHIH